MFLVDGETRLFKIQSINILVTGAAGFIGSNLVMRLLATEPDANIVGLDSVYGPAGRPDMPYFGFTNKLIKGEKIQIFNIGNSNPDDLLDFVQILQEELICAGALPAHCDFEVHKNW